MYCKTGVLFGFNKTEDYFFKFFTECSSFLNMTEGMRARVHSQFYGRKITYETIFYLPEILGQFLDKDNHVIESFIF